MERIWNPLSIQEILHVNDKSWPRIFVHMPCIPKLVKKNTWNFVPARKSDVVSDLDDLLHFPSLPFPSFSKNPSMSYPPRVFRENSKSPRVWERENNERAPTLNSKKVTNWSSEAFLWMRPLFSSFFHYFHSISSSHATCDLSPPFSPNFHYFHK